jgi:hypothetical protein
MRRLLMLMLATMVGVVVLAGPAHAQYAGGSAPHAGSVAPATHVLGTHFGAASNSASTSSGSATPDFLASTGADIAELVGIALLAIVVGTVMARRRRQYPLA